VGRMAEGRCTAGRMGGAGPSRRDREQVAGAQGRAQRDRSPRYEGVHLAHGTPEGVPGVCAVLSARGDSRLPVLTGGDWTVYPRHLQGAFALLSPVPWASGPLRWPPVAARGVAGLCPGLSKVALSARWSAGGVGC